MSVVPSDSGSDKGGKLPSGPKPGPRHTTFFDDPVKDGLIRGIVTLATELSVTRERMRSLELVLRESGVLKPEAIDQLALEGTEEQARAAERQRLIRDLIGPLASLLD